ncbi:MAG: fibronectin type III domain-containing protein [Candidatus Eisenbacteria bacterium]|nr:fibronectin type III domain-containing protein [Candidatus Eisenbacteria bacterium]
MMRRGTPSWLFALVLTSLLCAAPAVQAQAEPPAAPRPPSGLMFADIPDDAGSAVKLDWRLSPDDSAGVGVVTGYVLERGDSPVGPWTLVDSLLARTSTTVDNRIKRNHAYFYRITAYGPGGTTPALASAGPAIGRESWFNSTRTSVLVFLVVFFLLVLYYMSAAQGGKKPFVRRLAGIDAIEEAIGRATEMGRPVLYVPGIQDIDEIQTVAALVILESVARMTARYETPIRVPVAYPIPFTIAQEMVKSGYVNAGRPEAYEPDSVSFVSPEQFAYAAKLSGIMLRDKPAAHLFMGSFYGESLLLAETGFATGAIQVAGTANVHQLPFFVVACDYTLIGEELFAASAYLSGEPRLVGGLKGADVLKLLIIVTILVGCVLETFGHHGLTQWMQTQ